VDVQDNQKTVVYGPVHSHQLGRYIGMNLFTTEKVYCPFNCVYCHHNQHIKYPYHFDAIKEELPKPPEIARELRRFLEAENNIDYIAFAGKGESTLHPQFGEIVDQIIRIRDELAPSVDICVFSNSSTLDQTAVLEALSRVEVPIMKLDAGYELLFNRINRPMEGVSFDRVVSGLKKLSSFYLQTVFIDGKNSNIRPKAIRDWMQVVDEIKPTSVHLYTAKGHNERQQVDEVPREKLDEIGKQLKEKTGIPYCVYGWISDHGCGPLL
jgi:wyosine [tRNA(Phe)-imidazoG37] synthetase (radical SAM superfamily)